MRNALTADVSFNRFKRAGSQLIFIIAIAVVASSCEKVDSGRLYSRNLELKYARTDDVRERLKDIQELVGAQERNVQRDLDGNEMYLYSDRDVVIFVRREFGSECESETCPWTLTVSSTDTSVPISTQKELVDNAIKSLRNLDSFSGKNV